ncbi:MAG: 30S ribosomal protein S17 [Candidatus Lokiarchaeota archaeon]
MSRNIGYGIPTPKVKPEECTDEFCPFHGTTRIRGKMMEGVVVSKKSKNTAIIRQDYVQFIKKYQRYERRNSRIACHLPDCLEDEIKVGDLVKVGESRRISKTKAFIILEKVKGGVD